MPSTYLDRSAAALPGILASMERPRPAWPVGPISARGREVVWLMSSYGLPLSDRPIVGAALRSARSEAGMGLALLTAATAVLMGASDVEAGGLARKAVEQHRRGI